MSAYPPWLKIKAVSLAEQNKVEKILRTSKLHTVCEQAKCPNLGECFAQKTATFLIMGYECTRSCGFCAVQHGKPAAVDPMEPSRLAEAVRAMGLKYVVITSVARDDLSDGGAAHFASSIRAVSNSNAGIRIEVLIPDFQGSIEALRIVVEAKPAVVNHNLETVLRLYPKVRPEADYNRSLEVLRSIKQLSKDTLTKSGLMLGLGENEQEIYQAMEDLREVDCDLLTIGQYLAPSSEHVPVQRYYSPAEFETIRKRGLNLGFKYVASAPLVRSSYHAVDAYAASAY